MTYPKLSDAMETLLRRKFIALGASKEKLKKAYTSNLTAHLKSLQQKEVHTPQRSKWQEILKLRDEINQTEIKRTVQRIHKTKSWFFEKIKKIDIPLARLTRGHRDSI
jgi:hypothetical protein